MKVIFLDHDGVICLASEHGGRYKKQPLEGEFIQQKLVIVI